MAETGPPGAKPQVIHGYGNAAFRIAGELHQGSVIVFPDRTLPWPVTRFEEITEAALGPVFTVQVALDLLLLGCGPAMRLVPAELRAALRRVGIAVEPMDTGAACRTFNVLLAEQRRVAAALIALA